MQFTECLYYGHSTPALRTRVRAAALVSNDPGSGFTEERTSQIPGIFLPCVQFCRRPIYGRFAGTTFPNSKNYCTNDISGEISQIFYSYDLYYVKLSLWKRIRSNLTRSSCLRIVLILIFRDFLKDSDHQISDRSIRIAQSGREEFSTSKSKKSVFPFFYFVKFVPSSICFAHFRQRRSLAKLGSIGDEMAKFARRAPRAK